MPRNEKDTRIELIDPALRRAGWKVLSDKYIIEKNSACIETPVAGMPKTTENPTGNGFVDYVLFGDDGKPLGLIEAKKSVVNEEQGRVQACLYADCLEKQYGIRPVIYYTNGYSIKVIDGVYPAREIFGFHKKDELEYLIQRRNNTIPDKHPDPNICNRYYQQDAIEEILKHLGTKHSRSLIVLATGTGKTRVSCALSDIFIRNNFVKRILFLADRKNLVVQAKEETFEKFLPSIPMAAIIEGRREPNEAQARIVFSTYQSMISIIRDTSTCPYGIGHFDLIIVDEAHRSLFNKYAEIFQYFDALMIGLTATPRNDIHKSTFKVFNLDNEMPNYEYDVVKGVKDGYLTYFRALDRTPDILKDGVTYADLSDEEKEEYEDLFTEEDGTIPEKIEGKEFETVIYNKDTIRAVLRDLMEEGIYVNNGDVLGKTIIFARNHNHAVLIQDEFRKMYPELCNPNPVNGVDYCVIIDNKIRYNEVLQREFKNKQDIRIVVSVDMMDTGVDIPEIVNLVFFKRVASKIKFWQMLGRGTRLCSDIKAVSPSKSYFERQTNDGTRQLYNSKQGFLVFDICNVFPFFKLNPDGRKDASSQVLSLYQKIFLEKVALFKAMQNNYASLSNEEKDYYADLRDALVNEVKNLNRNYIGVIANLKYVEHYSSSSNWLDFKQIDFKEIKEHIAPQVSGEIDMESARFFDYLCYKLAASKYYKNNTFALTAKTMFILAQYLLNNKLTNSEVAKHEDALRFVASDELLKDNKVTKINEIRLEIRDLIRYIEREILEPIISDFNDKISSTEDAEDEDVDFTVTVDDFKTLEEKALFYIKSHHDEPVIKQIQNLIKPTAEAIARFKAEMSAIAKSVEEYNALFGTDEETVTFIRKNIEINPDSLDRFLNEQMTKGLNDMQLAYVKELITFIFQNGRFERTDLLREELNFGGLFDSIQIGRLIADIESVV